MESTWDIVFACKTEFINRKIREQKTAFLGAFNYKTGCFAPRSLRFRSDGRETNNTWPWNLHFAMCG